MTPRIEVTNRQRAVRVDLAGMCDFAQRALAMCLSLPRRKSGGLASLAEINVVFVADRRIAELHRRFMQESGATDVITFQHGEIVISTQTAKRQARQCGTNVQHELRLYLVHGLLHLHGFDDKTKAGAAEMTQTQERIVASLG